MITFTQQECKTEVSYDVRTINSFRSSTVADSLQQDSILVSQLQSVVFSENQSLNSIY